MELDIVGAAPSNKRARLDEFKFNPSIDLSSAESSTSSSSSASSSIQTSSLNMDLGNTDQLSELSYSQKTAEN